jgi:peptidyl-prolyl cis-trans isomerase SurA
MKPLLLSLLLLAPLGCGAADTAGDIGPKAYEAIPALHKAGKFVEAAKAAQALVAARTKALGADDQETLRARLLLAPILLDLNKESEAEAQLRELLPVMTRVFGAEQRESLACQSDLLAATAAVGKNTEAEADYRGFIPIAQRVLGPANDLTLKTRWRFAGVLYALGKREAADLEYRQSLELSLSRLSFKDRNSLNSEATKALTARIEKRHLEALKVLQKMVPQQTRLLGPEHPDTLRSSSELAVNVEAQGYKPEAEQRLRTVLTRQQRVLGAMHPDTLDTTHSLALCLHAQHKDPEALPYAQHALAGSLKVFGPEHTDTLLCQSLVAALSRPAPASPPPASILEDRPLATVDGTPVLASDVRKMIEVGEEEYRSKFASDPQKLKQELDKLQRTAIDKLIDQQLLANELPRIGGSVKPELLEQDLNDVIKSSASGTRAGFEAELAKDGLTLEKFRAARQRMILSTIMRQHIAGQIDVTEEQVRDYYDKHPDLWTSEEVKLHTITIPETLHQTDAATRTHVENLRTQLANGANFPTLARAESKDSHAEDGGAWGWTPITELSEKVRAAIARTPDGTVSGIIEQPGLFILVSVEARRTPPPQPFEKVKNQAANLLKQELGNQHVEKVLVRLRAAADIQKLEPVQDQKTPRAKASATSL